MFIEPHLNTRDQRVGRILESYGDGSGLHNCLKFSQPSSCLDEAISVNTEKVLYCLNAIRLLFYISSINVRYVRYI